MLVFTAIYNEMPWTPYFLRHLLEYDCPIVISEGAPQVFPDNPRSDDGSLELVREFADQHRDRVTLYETEPGFDRRHVEHQIWHERLEEGELYLGLGADNYFTPKTIQAIRRAMEDPANEHIYQMLTGMLVFVFNFRTVVTIAKPGLCGWWVKWWPCIYRKNQEFQIRLGSELLYDPDSGKCLVDPPSMAKGEISPHVLLRPDLVNYHYKGVKRRISRRVRYGETGAKAWESHPLSAEYFQTYDGPHPTLLSRHPWRLVKDCRVTQVDHSVEEWLWE